MTSEHSTQAAGRDQATAGAFDVPDDEPGALANALRKCLRYRRLYYCNFLLFLVLGILFYLFGPHKYTATAVLGPVTSSSPTSEGGLGSAVAALGTHLAGGADANQEFTDYSQVLTSTRLSDVLIRKDDFLKLAFAGDWDPVGKKWNMGIIWDLKNFIAKLSGGFPKTAPDVDDLNRFLLRNLSVDQVQPVTASSILTSSSILSVSLTTDNPHEAERMLRLIVDEADSILRADEKRDVEARIAHLQALLPEVTLEEQKEALTSVLASQLDTETMIESDRRFASLILDAPYADLWPTFPRASLVILAVIFLTITVSSGMILAMSGSGRILALLDPEKPARSVDMNPPLASRAIF